MKQIIGDPGKRRRYDPDLARKVNEEVRRGKFKVNNVKRIPVDIEEICRSYEYFMKDSVPHSELVASSLEFTPNSDQILEFVKFLPGYLNKRNSDLRTAMYINALMEKSGEDYFLLELGELNKQGIFISYICRLLKGKEVVINGDVRDNLGLFAKDSVIAINGNAGLKLGHAAKNCTITVNGNAGEDVGNNATNCKFFLKEFTNLSDEIGKETEIYKLHKGKYKLIYPKPK